MNTGWREEPLGNLVSYLRGLTYSKSDEVEFSNNIVLRANNVDLATNMLDFAELKYIKDSFTIPVGKKVRKDSIIICTASGSKSHLGKVAYIDEDYDHAFGGFMGMIIPGNKILPKYLFHLMTSGLYKEFIAGLSDGVNINNLKFDDLAQFSVPYPSKEEQQRIVAILDEAFAAIATAKANAEKNVHNARSILMEHLHIVFNQKGNGWLEKCLGEVCEMYQPKTIGTKDLVENGPYPVFGANGIIGRYDRFNHEAPQLLITCRGATCGSVNVSEPNSWITGNAMVVRPIGNDLDLLFLEFFFRGGIDISMAITGAAQPQITRTNLAPLLICYPKSVGKQKELAAQFENIAGEAQSLAAIYQLKVVELDSLKRSMLHQAFSGQLTAKATGQTLAEAAL